MIRDCLLPELGENIESATVVEVLVAVGDAIEVDQPLLSLETDKAEFEMPAPLAGRITEMFIGAGAEVSVGQLLLRVEAADDPRASHVDAAPTTEEAAASAAAPVAQPPAQLPEAEASETAEQPSSAAVAAPAEPVAAEAKAAGAGAVAAPSVRRLARELGIDIAAVTAAASHGRVSADDVLRHARALIGSATATGGAGAQPVDSSRFGEIERQPMNKVRRKTAEQMALAWSEIPHVTHFDKADISELDVLRRRYAARAERAGGKLTMTAVLLKVLGAALRRYAKFNASIDMARSEVVFKRYVNIGVAVDTDKGLLVPVIRDVDTKNIIEIACELREISERARNRNIRPEMLQGATFTLTNLGGIGGNAFSPLINPPEVAVVGVSRASREPCWLGEKFEPRLMLPLSLSYDHRLIDGADAARFLRWVCEALEEPFVLELEGE